MSHRFIHKIPTSIRNQNLNSWSNTELCYEHLSETYIQTNVSYMVMGNKIDDTLEIKHILETPYSHNFLMLKKDLEYLKIIYNI